MGMAVITILFFVDDTVNENINISFRPAGSPTEKKHGWKN